MKTKILEQLAEAEMSLFYAKNKNPKIEPIWQLSKQALEEYAKAIGLKSFYKEKE